MNTASPIFLSTLVSLVAGVYRFFKTRQARGKLTTGFWSACVIFFVATSIRNSIERRCAGIDPFEILGLEPTKEGIARLAKKALKRRPDDEALIDAISQIKEFPVQTVTYLWPFVNNRLLRCPYAEPTVLDVAAILGPVLFMRFLSYIAQILIASTVCPTIGNIKGPLSWIAVGVHLCEILIVSMASKDKMVYSQVVLGSDFCLSLLSVLYIVLEMRILAPNRADPASVVKAVRQRLDAVNNTQAACKNVTEEICSSKELLLLYGGWMRSVDSQPPPKAAQGPFARVRKSEDPLAFALQYSG